MFCTSASRYPLFRYEYEAYLYEYIQWLGYTELEVYDLYERTLGGYLVWDYFRQQNEDLIEQPVILKEVRICTTSIGDTS